MSLPLKKRFWKAIVKKKIENQAEALRLIGDPGCITLKEIAESVRSGDPNNREAVAAKYYFPRLKSGYSRNEVSPKGTVPFGAVTSPS